MRRHKLRRWIKRICLSLLALVVIVIVSALVFVHTSFGRDKIRGIVETQLGHRFAGKTTIGKLEGSPFGELVLRDIVICDVDHRPAIKIGALKLRLRAFDLLAHRVKLDELIAEDVDVALGRDPQALLAPSPPSTEPAAKSAWTIDLPVIAVRRAHIAIDTGSTDLARIELADLEIDASVHLGTDTERALIALTARMDKTPVTAAVAIDLVARHATGMLVAGDLDIARLTHGKVHATGAAVIAFDATAGAPGELPTATVSIAGHAAYEGAQRTHLTIHVATSAHHASAQLDTVGAVRAKISAELDRTAQRLTLERSHVTLAVRDPADASGNKVPAHGAIDLDLSAYGELSPAPDLAITGELDGSQLRAYDVTIASAKIAIDARSVPGKPRGSASVQLTDIVHHDMQLGALAIDARSLPDERIAVAITSHPKQARWLIELAALVTPPRADGSIVIELGRHHVRTGTGTDWRGDGGTLALGSNTITLAGLRTASGAGELALDASYHPKSKDLTARLDVKGFALTAIHTGYFGTANAHVEVARREGRWNGDLKLDGTGVAVAPNVVPIDVHAAIAARPGQVTVHTSVATLTSSVHLALDLAAPERLDDPAAWRRLDRRAIRSAKLELQHVDVGGIAKRFDQQLTGVVDGELAISATDVTGAIRARGVTSSAVRGVRSIDADLAIAQPTATVIAPSLTIKLADIGKVAAQAEIELPARPFDPVSWRKLGTKALLGASIETDRIVIDPGMLARFGVRSTMRGKASCRLEVADAAESVSLIATIEDMRGMPIAQPVNLALSAKIDGKAATASVGVTAAAKPGGAKQRVSLIQLDSTIPISLAMLRAEPARVRSAPLTATVTIAPTSAPLLLAVFGRSEISDGSLQGKIAIGGTLAQPTVAAHVTGDHLRLATGTRGRPAATLDELAIDASWNHHHASLAITGSEGAGGKLAVHASVDPSQLAAATAQLDATKFDLAPLLAFAPGPAGGATGVLDGKLAVTSFDPRTMKLIGEVHLHGARLPIAPTVGTLRDSDLDIKLAQHEITITGSGKLSAGTVKLDGSIALDGAAVGGGNAKLVLRKVSPIGAVQPVIDADVSAKLVKSGTQWTANVTIDNGFVKIPKQDGEKLKPVGMPSDLTIGHVKVAPKPAAATPNIAPVIVAMITLHDTKVESAEFRTTLHGSLKLEADANAVRMTGAITAEGGDLDLFDRRYRVDRAAVQFDGPPDPVLDIRFSYDFPDVETVTTVTERLSKPKLTLTSNPGGYSQSELLGFLLGGEPGGDPNSGSARDKAAEVGTSLVANQIGGYLRKALPFDIDVIRYEAASVTSGPAITVGSWITHSLFFAFREHLDDRPDENTSEGTLEYWITRKLAVQTTAGDRNYDGIDMLWRKHF